MTVKERINQFIDYKGIRINAFELSIGVSKSYWSNTQKISAEVVAEILRVYSELSAEWLMRGEGEMIKGNTAVKEKSASKEFVVYVDENGFLKMK
ncbi:helix-turn-helix domain-containing protein [Bacteroides clarus]|uniref:helix-turn-helix domain-containing protein n=1 Tax=Bacteroides clarus TaxID=626929 RepID=UPI002101D0B7|nr:helix-turn-helix domain-containing protein [Bacteroides clarus]MCQ1546163.1 helix-turn-helix domain-containing protein [Bacteroides clarus]